MSERFTFAKAFDILMPIDDARNVRDKALMRQQAKRLDAQLHELGWVHPVRCHECAWLGQALSDDEAVCEYFDATTRWNDYCSHGEVRDEGD